jgi:hypothetical protein
MIHRFLDLTVAVLREMYFGAYLKFWMPESDFAAYWRLTIEVGFAFALALIARPFLSHTGYAPELQ